jgi:hypothetical protein
MKSALMVVGYANMVNKCLVRYETLVCSELTVKVGRAIEEVADSTTEEASLATLEAAEEASLRTD